jgi:hypothetical protein
MIPLVTFEEITKEEANKLLILWGHKMGPLCRGNQAGLHYALIHNDKPVALTSQSNLISPVVGGGLNYLTRDNTIELSRLCAERTNLCRVALRLWREFVFPLTDYQYAISYQDADLHNGNIYRFDGWKRVGYSRSGTDTRSGRKGRNKYIWEWARCA